MGPLQRTLWAGGGFATFGQLSAAGATSKRLGKLVAAGQLQRPRRGLYALPAAPPKGVSALRLGGRLGGISAAETFGLWGGWDEPLTVCLSRTSSGRTAARRSRNGLPSGLAADGVELHWTDDGRDEAWCWRVALERCLVQTLRWSDAETAVAVLDTALTAKSVTLDRLLQRVEHSPPLTRLVRSARPGSMSGVESIFRQRLEAAGLAVTQQPEIDGVGFVDFQLDETRVLVEVDGYRFHSSPEKFADDRRRDVEARFRGYVPLRFTALQVRDRWPWVERMVLGAVAQASDVAWVGR